MRILAYKVKNMMNQGKKFFKVVNGSLSNEEIVSSQLFLDRRWLDFLQIAEAPITYKGQE